ncbi:N-acetylglucosamine kinase [Oceanobacillus longus]|uniref:N-acetylglucosamine kinase n=1 Tax=Oceanobacillus longus TaxID=930120 RepID=A0ABV8GW44_9BACI
MGFVLGIDGGGTKTVAAIADRNGDILAQTRTGSTNPNATSKQELEKIFRGLFSVLEEQLPDSFQKITHLFAGIAGAGNKANQIFLKEMIKRFVPATTSVVVEPDTINALYSGTYGKPGIVQISGTGSITYGIDSSLKHARVGGWGYLLGDEGSGYDIGRQGMMAVLKAYDGRGIDTDMSQKMFTFFKVDNGQDLIQKIYTSPRPKNEISALSKIVIQSYHKQDPVAEGIIANVIEEITCSIETLYKKLFSEHDKVRVVLCGGVFSEKTISELIKKSLSKNPHTTVVLPDMPPVGGSIIGAYVLQGELPTKEMIKNIKGTIQ